MIEESRKRERKLDIEELPTEFLQDLELLEQER